MGRCRGWSRGHSIRGILLTPRVPCQTDEAWFTYETFMVHHDLEELPQLESTINSEDYLDAMSAPRIDPARPEMTGWAMKQNRLKQKAGTSGSEDEEG